jgi:hypothetical protein
MNTASAAGRPSLTPSGTPMHFRCALCGFESRVDFYGRRPSWSPHIVFSEDAFVLRDPVGVAPTHPLCIGAACSIWCGSVAQLLTAVRLKCSYLPPQAATYRRPADTLPHTLGGPCAHPLPCSARTAVAQSVPRRNARCSTCAGSAPSASASRLSSPSCPPKLGPHEMNSVDVLRSLSSVLAPAELSAVVGGGVGGGRACAAPPPPRHHHANR